MVDRTLGAHSVQDAPNPLHQRAVIGLTAVTVERVVHGESLERCSRRPDHALGMGVDLGGDRAGELEGATCSGVQAELHGRVERETSAHPGADRRGDSAQRGGVPEGAEGLTVGAVRGNDPVPREAVVASAADHLVNQCVKGERPVADGFAQHGTQGQGVRAGLDKASAVRGVLDRVGEDEGLFLPGVKLGGTEQGRQRHREQRRDRAAKEPDAVLLTARRAHVVPSGLVSILASGRQDRQHPTVPQVRVIVRWRLRQERAAAHREPHEAFGRLALAEERTVGLPGGEDQRTEPALVSGVVAADRLVIGGKVGADGGKPDAPAGAAAVAAVDGREGGAHVIGIDAGDRRAVVAPPETRRRVGGAVDAGELTHPQVHIHRQCAATRHSSHVTEHRDDVREELLPLRVDTGDRQRSGARGTKHGGGEVLDGDGIGGGRSHGLHERVRAHDIEQHLCGGTVGDVDRRPGQRRRERGQRRKCAGRSVVTLVQGAEHDVGQRRGGRVVAELVNLVIGRHHIDRCCGARNEAQRGGAVDSPAGPLVETESGLGDDGSLIELFAEDGSGEVDHDGGVALVSEGCGRCDRGYPAKRARAVLVREMRVVVGPVALEGEAEAAQQHGDVGALGAVVGVELVKDEVLQARGALPPDVLVVAAQQKLVEHLVVGQQDVRRSVPDDAAVGDEPVGRDSGPSRPALPRVEGRGGAGQRRMRGQDLRETQCLVVCQSVHRVQDQRLGACDSVPASAQHVVEDRIEERLGLARAGSRRDQRGLRPAATPGDRRRQARERLRLVTVGREALIPLERVPPALACWPERQAQTNVGPLEHPRLGIGQELIQGLAGVGVGERECRHQVVEQPATNALRLGGWQQLAHARSFRSCSKWA
ncbi:hypothetical protein GALL_284920 [mine drainage metagenome]|uniref:Uncharacterized protein n=1 Tax=mine drainage metagenome TaxID=410659 RepID=A0A1J5RNB2_9ZZZZ